jgi:hypothetical protein
MCSADGCYESFERDDGDTRTTKCPACRAKERAGNRSALTRQQGQSEVTRFASKEERELAQAVLSMAPPRGHRLQSETINIDFGRGTMNIDRKFEPEPTVSSTGLGILGSWLGRRS